MELSTEIKAMISIDAQDLHDNITIREYKYQRKPIIDILTQYAEKWQLAEAKAARYEQALKDIISPIAYLQRKVAEEGAGIDGYYAQELANNVTFLQGIAEKAITPKTSEDEHS